MRIYVVWLWIYIVQPFHVCIPLELGQVPSSSSGLSLLSICSIICSTNTSVCDRFSNTSSKKKSFSMETSLSLYMANAFMPCLSIGSHTSLASFLLLMCWKKNLLLLFMPLQVFFLKAYFGIHLHLMCQCLWPCLRPSVVYNLTFMKAAFLFLRTSLPIQPRPDWRSLWVYWTFPLVYCKVFPTITQGWN